MQIELLRSLFQINYHAIEVNLAGLTHEDSLRAPEPGGNCINWVLGHILSNRNRILALAGKEPRWSGEKEARFRRGSAPVHGPEDAEPLDAMRADLSHSQAELMAALEAMDDARLDAPAGDRTVGQSLAMLQFHEAYHAGQIGLLRRIAGKEGAIR
jgi:uncharacterized damage-inducible protein DinB